MQFQVLSSTINHSSNRGRGTVLEFCVFPCHREELKFSDGSRLMGCDLTENWGEPLTIGTLSQKLKRLGYENIDEDRFVPLDTTVLVTDQDWRTAAAFLKDKGIVQFLKDEEFACGYAQYRNDDSAYGLHFWLSVEKDVFRDLLLSKFDLCDRMTFHIDIRGLTQIGQTWDLDDQSDCGDGNYRVVTGFSLRRSVQHYSRDPQISCAEIARAEDRKEIGKVRSLLHPRE